MTDKLLHPTAALQPPPTLCRWSYDSQAILRSLREVPAVYFIVHVSQYGLREIC